MRRNQTKLILLLVWLLPSIGVSQEITIFKVTDFDLNGKVKSCLISTDYGKEEYQFDESGRLVEAVTHYNEADYDVTLYTYSNNELLEKRVESYRDQVLDKATSIANFYTYDTTKNRNVTEKVISYEKEFLEQYEYSYTIANKLSKIVRSNNDGIDETAVVYFEDEVSTSANYILNRELDKSINTKLEIVSDSTQLKTITTKKFIEGAPNTRTEEVFDQNNKLKRSTNFSYNTQLEKFVPEKSTVNEYASNGTLLKTTTTLAKKVAIKEFLYQYDINGNWIKQIVTPENSYKTRKIDYYDTPEAAKVEE